MFDKNEFNFILIIVNNISRQNVGELNETGIAAQNGLYKIQFKPNFEAIV